MRPTSLRPRGGPAALAGVLLLGAAAAGPLPAQNVAPRYEDAGLPSPGEVRLGFAPYFQSWHREFGPGGAEIPLAEDLEGPLLEQIHPGPGPVLQDLNRDAGALGFTPVTADEAAIGDLTVRELNTEMRTVAFRLEAGLLERVAVDLMVPVVRTEVEPFLSLDPSGATLGGAAAAVADRTAFFGAVGDARAALQARLAAGELSAGREDEARALLRASGDFASALEARVVENALLPLGGTRAGTQIEAFWAQLQSGFRSFGLTLPPFSLPEEGSAAFLDDFFVGTLATAPPGPTVRGWLAGETEVGVRFAVLRDWEGDREGLRARTTLGVRARLPFRGPNAVAFVDPTTLLGEPLGDGQRDVEISLYQDAGLGGWLELATTLRYGLQLADELTVAVRSPDRPLALPDRRVVVERDLGDYMRARVSPRIHLNPFLSLGLEYRYWHKGRDRFRTDSGADASALELQTEQTRHRLGVGATYRPVPRPQDDEPGKPVPELGFVYQTPVAGSGGETPAAGIATFHVTVPVRVF